jgi:hypothetical protein
MSDRNGLVTFEAGFHHATHVVIAALLVAVLIAQVDFDLRNVIAESAQGILHDASDLGGQHLVTFDVMVSMDLDLHGILLFSL